MLLSQNPKSQPVEGDGKAVFLPDMSDEEYKDYDKMENKGWKGFYEKIQQL